MQSNETPTVSGNVESVPEPSRQPIGDAISPSELQQLVERFQAEAERTGSLSLDRVLAICERRGIVGVSLESVVVSLAHEGLLERSPTRDVEGFGGRAGEDATFDEPYEAIDVLRQYLHEIGGHPLLSADDERVLGRRVRAMVDLRESLGDSRPDPSQVQVLRAGREAERQLIEANLRLVVSIAKRLQNRGLPMLDLIQEGNFGLFRATEKFDHRLGYKFSTYATWWIRQSIERGVANLGRSIRLPVHFIDRIRRIQRAQWHLSLEMHREPTLAELAAQVDLDPAAVQFALDWAADVDSLDRQVGEGGAVLGDFVRDANALDPIEVLTEASGFDGVREAIESLDDRTREIICLRFGIGETHPLTLEEVGKRCTPPVTRERIRQIEKKALKKLKQHPALREFRPTSITSVSQDATATDEQQTPEEPSLGVIGQQREDEFLLYVEQLDGPDAADYAFDLGAALDAGHEVPLIPDAPWASDVTAEVMRILAGDQDTVSARSKDDAAVERPR